MMLTTDPNFERADDFYAALLNAHEGLEKHQSDALNARLILILANQIGDHDTLLAALSAAQMGGATSDY